MRKLLLALVFGLLTLSFAINADAQQGVRSHRFTIAGPDSPINLVNTSIAWHKLTWNVSGGTASVCTAALDTSVNGSTWSAGGAITGQTCTSNGSSSVVNVTANYVRINMTALTVTAGSSVTVTWDGYTSNPVSSGVTGTGSPSQVAVWNGTSILSGNDNLRETSGTLSLGAAGLNSGLLTLEGSGSGSASIGVASVAGASNIILLPKTSGTPGQVLGTDGSSPQQTSWSPVLRVASVTLTSAQVLALFTTPIQIVPAPGTGFSNIPIEIEAQYKFVTTAYTLNGSALSIVNGSNVSLGGAPLVWSGVIDQTSSQIRTVASQSVNAASVFDNQGIFAKATVANPTLGDGTLTVTVFYNTVPTL